MTPCEAAQQVPSFHGWATDVFAHLQPGGYVLSTPDFFLLAREVDLSATADELLNPFHRFPPAECNALCLSLVAGDAIAAFRALVHIAGDREFVAWQTESGGVKIRRSGPGFLKFLETVANRRKSCPHGQRRRQ